MKIELLPPVLILVLISMYVISLIYNIWARTIIKIRGISNPVGKDSIAMIFLGPIHTYQIFKGWP